MRSLISKYIYVLLTKIFIYHYLCVYDVLVSEYTCHETSFVESAVSFHLNMSPRD